MTRIFEIGKSWWRRVTERFRGGPKELGTLGEAFAAKYLKKQGMKIVARNRHFRRGEIDLIAIDGEWLVFVEVRTRASEAFMRPEDSLRHHKRQVVARTVRQLTRRYGTAGLTPRIDIVAIVWPNGAKKPSEVRHHRGAIAVARW
ncbi:MAG: YraN family protein [Phycisphaerales bacterium]|nr:YraN family protein [Phycisphaerales bacterium]